MLVSGRVFGKWVSTFFSLKPGVAIPMDGCILYAPSHGLDARNHDINLSRSLSVHDMKKISPRKHKNTLKATRNTLPETNIASKNGWLEYYFPIGEAYFQGIC